MAGTIVNTGASGCAVRRLAFANRHRTVRAAASSAHPKIARRWAAILAVAAAATLQPASARAQPLAVRTVPFVDLDRYAGEWFEIARFENRFQRQCLGDVRATYARRADGRIDVVNQCRTSDGQTEARGVARLVDEQTRAKLKVRFAPAWLSWLPPVWGDYWIIGLAPDYSWAVVGDPGREYLWILARTPRLDAESMAAARAVAQDNGFDVGRLVETPQAGGKSLNDKQIQHVRGGIARHRSPMTLAIRLCVISLPRMAADLNRRGPGS
jgi:apolipoprotein D and lipocalin family protein